MKANRCVHCLARAVGVTKDYAPPKSWCPSGTPGVTAPSCFSCNAKYGELEINLLEGLAILVYRDPRAEHIKSKISRSFNSKVGRSPEDARARRLRKEHWENMIDVSGGVMFAPPDLASYAEKLTRVLTWNQSGMYIENPNVVYPLRHFVNEKTPYVPETDGTKIVDHCPGVQSIMRPTRMGCHWEFKFYDKLVLWTIVVDKHEKALPMDKFLKYTAPSEFPRRGLPQSGL